VGLGLVPAAADCNLDMVVEVPFHVMKNYPADLILTGSEIAKVKQVASPFYISAFYISRLSYWEDALLGEK
jgi:hypothetical protein